MTSWLETLHIDVVGGESPSDCHLLLRKPIDCVAFREESGRAVWYAVREETLSIRAEPTALYIQRIMVRPPKCLASLHFTGFMLPNWPPGKCLELAQCVDLAWEEGQRVLEIN